MGFRLDHLLLYRIEAVLIIPMNVALFLFGVRLARSGTFAADGAGRRVRRRMLRWGLMLGVPLNALVLVPDAPLDLPARYLFAPVLSLGYIGGVALVMERGLAPWLLDRAGEVGRMALSLYVLQNLLASVVFYGWGFGLTGRVGAAATLAVWAGICAAIAGFAHLWLRRYGVGPLEGVWRALGAVPFRPGRGARGDSGKGG